MIKGHGLQNRLGTNLTALKRMETIQKYEINFAQTFKIC